MSAASIGFLALAILVLAIALYRFKSVPDRLIAVDALSACGLGACLMAAAQTGHTAFLDVAIGFALVAFVATVAWANALGNTKDLS